MVICSDDYPKVLFIQQSLEMIDLLMQLETFGVTIPSAQIDATLTVHGIVERFVDGSCSERNQPTL
ncbi:hypothetical protein [Candidatus Symbiopectobacterium sp.]|uniref:hypothetical protein n=1 Tax=Candidatus Symbiopectobacterium sp. TaxID=2816440 RepID=UPI0025BA3824|nr:hypothetical protein [Candidatus Symbiopectobacterium sp.]